MKELGIETAQTLAQKTQEGINEFYNPNKEAFDSAELTKEDVQDTWSTAKDLQ